MPKKLKSLTDPNADFRKRPHTDEKAYPNMEAVPKFRQSARWECRRPEVARGRHHRSAKPTPTIALCLSRRSEPTCRPAYLTQATAQTFPSPSTPRSVIRRQPLLQATHALLGPSNCSNVFSGVTARHYLPIAIPFPL